MELVETKYIQTDLGLFPADWKIDRIESFIDLLTGFPFPSNSYAKSGLKLLRGSNIKRGITDWSDKNTEYWSSVSSDISKYLLKEGDIVIAMDGSLVGKSFAQLNKFDVPSLLLQRVARIRSNKIDIYYLKEFICSTYFTEHCDKVKTSSAIPHISPKDINDFVIPIPPTLAEQKAIAGVLSDTDALIQTLEKKIAKKKLIKKGAMQELLKPKEGWEVKALKDVGEIITGGTPPTANILFWNGNIPWITPTDIRKNKNISNSEREISTAGLNVIRKLPANTLLVTCIASIGKNAILREIGACNQQINAIIPNKYNDVDFLYYLIENNASYILGKAGITATLLISKKDFGEIPFSFPQSLHEQKHIALILSDMDKEIDQLEQKLSKYKKVKQGIMQQLLTGKIRLV